MAPEPRDVYWPNLSSGVAGTTIKIFRSLFVNFMLFLIIFFSIVTILGIVTFLSSLPDSDQFPIVRDFFKRMGKTAKEFIQQVVPIVLFASWTSSIPSLLTGNDLNINIYYVYIFINSCFYSL